MIMFVSNYSGHLQENLMIDEGFYKRKQNFMKLFKTLHTNDHFVHLSTALSKPYPTKSIQINATSQS